MIQLTTVSDKEELSQIIDLQKINLPKGLSQSEILEQGFVTVQHDLDILEKMNTPFPHIIAKDGDKVVGYALVMLESMRDEIAVLVSMFEKLDKLIINGNSLKGVAYFTMGQVCIDKAYRGLGIFDKLYQKMKLEMSPHFEYIITEVATRNKRSIRAHERVGFQELLVFESAGEEWSIIGWKIR